MKKYDWKNEYNPIRRMAKRLLSGEALTDGRPLSDLIELDEHTRKCLAFEATLTDRQIDMLQDFSIAKNAALEDMVNRKFEFIKIKMSEETLSGDIKETLRINVNGVDYFNGLNHGDRILAEIFLLKGLQDMNGIKLPIWIDDTESLDENRIPDVSHQLIVIRRTYDETLKVCNGEE